MNMKWGETGEDHNGCDFDMQENTNKNITQKTRERGASQKEKQEYHKPITTRLFRKNSKRNIMVWIN